MLLSRTQGERRELRQYATLRRKSPVGVEPVTEFRCHWAESDSAGLFKSKVSPRQFFVQLL